MEVAMPMKTAAPGPVTLLVYEFGQKEPDQLTLQAYAEAASLGGLALSAGDSDAVLKGTRLDEVAHAELNGIALTPAGLTRVRDLDQLVLSAQASTVHLEPDGHYLATVELRDGRKLTAPVTVNPPRPQVALMSKGAQPDPNSAAPAVTLGSVDDLPLQGRIVFFLKSNVPARFPRDEKVEVAAEDGSFGTVLGLADGSLVLEDAETAVGSVEPLARFGPSAFGPVRIRAISADGAAGDWLKLGTLVRVPGFKELRCPRATAKPCTLTGSSLYLADSIAANIDFDAATEIAHGFTGTQLMVPHPVNGTLYLKLRDDPQTVQTLALPVTPALPADAKAAAQGQQAAPAQSGPQPAADQNQPASGAEAPKTAPGTPAPPQA